METITFSKKKYHKKIYEFVTKILTFLNGIEFHKILNKKVML
jgi:hypothetical protein